ncbi:MAG: histidine kinase [Bacteroidota bacterium]
MTLSFVAILVGITLVILFNKYIQRNNKLLASKLEGDLENKRRIQMMELKALRSQMNPHFVHNSLNAIQYFIQRNEVELSETYLVKFSKLIRLFFEYSRRQTITVTQEVELLNNYLQIEQLRFEDKLNYTIRVDSMIESDQQTLPSMILQPMVENAVNHGLFHKKGSGKIRIQFIYVNEFTIKVQIADDGIGINKSIEMYRSSTQKYKSHSSAVLHERLELLNESKKWSISYSIQDLSEIRNTSGTIVTLTINQHDEL